MGTLPERQRSVRKTESKQAHFTGLSQSGKDSLYTIRRKNPVQRIGYREDA